MITASSSATPGVGPSVLFEWLEFSTAPECCATLFFDFGPKTFVTITHYSIRAGSSPLQSWDLHAGEGNDAATIVDHRRNVQELAHRRGVVSYAVENPTVRAKFVKLVQVSETPKPLAIRQIEFFGTLEFL
jgi:hypothetical protein